MNLIEYLKISIKGIFKQNPVFCLVLGMCPALAVTVSLENGIGMGLATLFVLVCSSMLISIMRKLIPNRIRIPVYIVIIATFVTVVSLIMEAFYPIVHKNLGIYVPLIVVNCIVLGRAEAYASRNSIGKSFLDALGMGVGFTGALIILGFLRELFGTSKIVLLGNTLFTTPLEPMSLAILPAGAFLLLGLSLGGYRFIKRKIQWKT